MKTIFKLGSIEVQGVKINDLEDFIKEINKNEDNCPFKVVGITRRG